MTSERDLIERLSRIAGHRPGVALGIGDDAAVLTGDPLIVVALDVVVDGVHFRRSTSSPGDIGHRALAVNLSDLAAMGAQPRAAFVGLSLPADGSFTEVDVEETYTAMDALAARFGVTVAGGDVTLAPALSLAVTAIGHMPAAIAPVTRSGARPGDVICITGVVGAAAAGLAILDRPALGRRTPHADALRRAHRRPDPRVSAGQTLANAGATAMIDCSDGLALDVQRVGIASGALVEIVLEALPLAPGVADVAVACDRDPDVFAATGGEDYELIVSLPRERVADARAALDVPLTEIGRVLDGVPGVRLTRAGVEIRPPSLGWEHRTA